MPEEFKLPPIDFNGKRREPAVKAPAAGPADKPLVYMIQPTYGRGVRESHRQFDINAGSKHCAIKAIGGSSLLAMAFNSAWCQALNYQLEGEPIKYFAMLHDDVVPGDGWVDILIGELEKHDADVMSAVVPIKDMLGLTSTAIDDPSSFWSPERRITMTELFHLPVTFSAADCGDKYKDRKLLVNTGCFVCRFDRDWRKHVHFQIHDRIEMRQTPAGPRYFTDVAPEDWNFSRDVQALGGKVMATRAVKITHVASAPFTNQQPWGDWQFDQAHAHKFGCQPIKGKAGLPKDAQPKRHSALGEFGSLIMGDVPGWMNDEEGKALQRLAKGKDVLEIGSYCGRSTIWLAKDANAIYAVDTFDGRGTPIPRDTQTEFRDNLTKHRVRDKVTIAVGISAQILPQLPKGRFDLIFIDGAHDQPSVKRDAELSLPLLRTGGVLVFHDYNRSSGQEGVTSVVDGLLAEGWNLAEVVGSIAVLRQAVPVQESIKEAELQTV